VVSYDPLLVGRTLRKWGLTIASAAVVGVAAVGGLGAAATAAQARDNAGAAPGSTLATVRLSDLPDEARRTESLIRAGGPFPYAKDGTVFGNRERLLPRQPRGHYREYTVRTPGSRDRGARRIVCGGERPREPEACYYTQDHYASFRRIVP
jgi:ribonuclease T1